MNKDELKKALERRATLLAEAQKPETTAERFAEIRNEVEKLNFAIAEAEKDITAEEKRNAEAAAKAKAEEESRAARLPNGNGGVIFNQSATPSAEELRARAEKVEKRAKSLKNGEKVTVEVRAVASSSTALGTATSNEINPAFAQVGTLDELVNAVHLEGAGAESYKKPFAKTIGEGAITEEGKAPSSNAEPTFDYAAINKVKIVAYAEVNEEVEKLPSANYIAEVDASVLAAWRKKVNGQIVNGSGDGELVGIVNTPEKIIAASTKKTIAAIDENTLDNIIFDYGGDEDVEGDATLILNKLTLKEFAKVKGSDKRRAYDIVVKGNSGTINGIPFVCTSKVAAFGSVTAGNPYLIYGKLKGYELAYFSNLDVEKSTEYKFKEGVICFKVSGHVGGSPAMYNGFMSVIKEAKATQT